MDALDTDSKIYKIRHSLAHVLAQAVQQKYPKAKLGFGPPIENGFYYDFDFGDSVISEGDLKEFEKSMRKIINQGQAFERMDGDFAQANEILAKHADEPYKQENLKNLHERGAKNFSFYKNGSFMDVCEGPHVANSKELPADAFKLDRIAGAYWLGDDKRPMLTRIYALAFETKEELQDYMKRRELAATFDHKKLGKELELFHFDDQVGKGLPLWLPAGAAIRNSIERYAEELEFKYGYQRVATPHISKGTLYEKSGHIPAYLDSMFPPMQVNEGTGSEEKKADYYLKPMNCPHHHMIYAARPRSYRELPLRLAEYGTVYRYEQSGELSGLIRVRGMSMNDAHIYLRPDQFVAEFKSILEMYREFYSTFKLSEFKCRLSVSGKDNAEKFKGEAEMWRDAEKLLEDGVKESGFEYYRGEGEAAFYGPKVDFQFRNLMGREETVSTIQVDFLMPKNFDLTYVDDHGQLQKPIIIHRAPLSTHERFISFLIEYYGGAFPTWCAPVQVCFIPVNELATEYARGLERDLRQHQVRIEIDDSDNSFNKKIRTNTKRKIPILVIVGDKEVENKEVTLRRYGIEAQETIGCESFKSILLEEIKDRNMLREPMTSLI